MPRHSLSQLRANLTTGQAGLLAFVWRRLREAGKWPGRLEVHLPLKPLDVVDVAGSLGGSIIRERTGGGMDQTTYQLTTLGMLLGPDGRTLQALLLRYLKDVKSAVLRDPTSLVMTSDALKERLGLTGDEVELIGIGVFGDHEQPWNTGGAHGHDSWSTNVASFIEDLLDCQSVGAWFEACVLRGYDPGAPVAPDTSIPCLVDGRVRTFDLIRDPALRSILEHDYQEAHMAHKAGAWKASAVLSGCVIEGLLLGSLEHVLVRHGEVNAQEAKLGHKRLAALVELAQKHELIRQPTGELVRVVKFLRNLVHPGRQRLEGVAVSKASADTARAAVEWVLEECGKSLSARTE